MCLARSRLIKHPHVASPPARRQTHSGMAWCRPVHVPASLSECVGAALRFRVWPGRCPAWEREQVQSCDTWPLSAQSGPWTARESY